MPISFQNEKNKNKRNIQNLENNFLNLQINSIETTNTNNNIIKTTKEIENEFDNNRIINIKINNEDKANIITNENNNIILGEEKKKKKIKLNEIQIKKNRRSIKNLPPFQKNNITSSKDSLIKPKNKEITDNQIINKSFLDCYWKYCH